MSTKITGGDLPKSQDSLRTALERKTPTQKKSKIIHQNNNLVGGGR
ncbi:hypothetical protein [Rhizomicrobium palustre]